MGLEHAHLSGRESTAHANAMGLEDVRILVVGATGLVGSELVRQLLADKRCKELIVLARRPLDIAGGDKGRTFDKLRVLVADFDRIEEALSGVRVDVVLCALGTTIKKAKTRDAFYKVDCSYPVAVAEWAKRTGVVKMVVVSAMGAKASSRIFYNRVKGEMEEKLASIGVAELHIFRPSLLLGARDEFRFGEQVAIRTAPILKRLMIGPLRAYQPIKAGDVAAAMRTASFIGPPQGKTSIVRIYENEEIAAIAAQDTVNSAG
ncbi:NAD(P)H-binding protein [Paenibacillus sp. sptzw28]|uniref:NAD(P)H-binding protein n=1 Tax=Paenibacillus sp. sptzw28 TaxID=715179 RepID=UPI001C6E47D8|nr:NAD(P)H-binding protein [Paenibacillus sp. sptzw28]QYR21617.1 NAD(P)H-binding protein [Paenibacillus sp. sptzw28]